MAKNQFRFGTSEQVFITQTKLAPVLCVEPRTVRDWIKKKWLTPRYRLLGGRLQTVFLTQEVERFLDWYLASLKSLDAPCEPGSRHDRINSLRAKSRRRANKASQAAMKKHLADVYGTPTGQDEDDPDANYQEPATLNRGSTRRGSNYPDHTSISDRDPDEGSWPDSWDDDVEGKA